MEKVPSLEGIVLKNLLYKPSQPYKGHTIENEIIEFN